MYSLSRIKVRRTLVFGSVLVSAVAVPRTAAAIDHESANQVGECVWPNVVGVSNGSHCTGVVLTKDSVTGEQFILTAAHCVEFAAYENIQTGELDMRITFGRTQMAEGWRRSI